MRFAKNVEMQVMFLLSVRSEAERQISTRTFMRWRIDMTSFVEKFLPMIAQFLKLGGKFLTDLVLKPTLGLSDTT